MDNFRKSLIEELMLTLKIPQGNFNFATIASEIELISNDRLKEFYKLVMISDSYGNGMKAIIQVAEQFKPKPLEPIIDATTAEARRLISACETMNTILFNECNKLGIPFDDYVRDYNFTNLQASTKALLNAVKPYKDYKRLIVNIRHYPTSIDTENAFKKAITHSNREDTATIENHHMRKLIKGVL